MNTHISRSIVFAATLSVSAILSACGEDNFSSKPIAPGEECFAGGTRYIIDGEETVVCNGSTRNERVEVGRDNNPCHGAATRVTTQSDTGSISQEWFCEGVTREELDEEGKLLYDFTAMYIAQLNYQLHLRELCENVGEEDIDEVTSPVVEAKNYDDVLACAAYEISGFTRPIFRTPEYLRCVVPSAEAIVSCLSERPTEPVGESPWECRNLYEEESSDCLGISTRAQSCAIELGFDEEELEMESAPMMIAIQTIATLCGLTDSFLD